MCCVEFYGVTFLFFLDFFFPPFRISFASDRPHSLLGVPFFFFSFRVLKAIFLSVITILIYIFLKVLQRNF